MSAAGPLTVLVGGVLPGQEESLIGAISPGLERSDFGGFVGMELRVGSRPLTITGLGRLMLEGNNRTHLLKLVLASTGQDVPYGSVQVSMLGGLPGEFKYESLFFPITLEPQVNYFLVSEEIVDGDSWYDVTRTTVSSSSAATVAGGVFGGPPWTMGGLPDHVYGPVSFRYLNEAAGFRLSAGWEGGQFRLQLLGQGGKTYRVEAGPDLERWEELGVYQVGDGPVLVIDLASALLTRRFYRAVELP